VPQKHKPTKSEISTITKLFHLLAKCQSSLLLWGLITKTSYDFSLQNYLQSDHKSIVSSRLTGKIPYDLSYDYRKLTRDLKASRSARPRGQIMWPRPHSVVASF